MVKVGVSQSPPLAKGVWPIAKMMIALSKHSRMSHGAVPLLRAVPTLKQYQQHGAAGKWHLVKAKACAKPEDNGLLKSCRLEENGQLPLIPASGRASKVGFTSAVLALEINVETNTACDIIQQA